MNPAPVSGPGSLSQRTDGGPADMAKQAAKTTTGFPWGEGETFMQQQNAAPMAAAPSIEQSSMPSGLASAAASQPLIPLNSPSQWSDTPVTDGAELGPGRGMEALGLANVNPQADAQVLAQYFPILDSMARKENVPESFRVFVSALRGRLGR
jgi:hypothetical protein